MEAVLPRAEYLDAPPSGGEWDALLARTPPAVRFLTPGWFEAWARHLVPYDSWRGPVRYLAARAPDGCLEAALPLATQKRHGLAVASLGGLYWPFRAPLVAANAGTATLDAMARQLARRPASLALRLGPVAEDDAGVAALVAALARQGWRLNRDVLGVTHAVDLPATWEAFEARLGKSLRTAMRYGERRLAREGDLDIRCVRGGDEGRWREALDDLAAVERASWQFRARGALRFHGERNTAFWRALLVAGGFGEHAAAWILRFRGRPASLCFCVDSGDTRYVLANNYDESVRRYSTGSVLYRHVFDDAIASGRLRTVNIGAGDSGYKARWSARPAFRLVDWIGFAPGLRGAAIDVAWRLRRGGRDRQRGDEGREQEPAEVPA